MPSEDNRSRFLFESLAIRGEIVRLDDTVRTVLAKHDYPATARTLLAEALTAAALLAGTLKFEGLLSIQARGDGPLRLLVAECTDDGRLRAIARHDGPLTAAPLDSLLGEAGTLAITIDPVGGQRYQGVVPLDGGSLAECVEYYFRQSEQLATRLWLVTDGARAAGLLLQEMPGSASSMPDHDAWNRLCRLTDTLTAAELLGLPIGQLLHRLYHQEDVRLFAAEPLHFACSCSRERTLRALAGLTPGELAAILEGTDQIEVVCEFCREKRSFSAKDLGRD